MTPARRFGLDVLAAYVGFLALAGVLVLVVEGVEQSRWFEQLDVASWLRFVAVRIPGRLAAVMPVIAVCAAAAVTARWEASGAFEAVEAAGHRPGRFVGAAAIAVLAVTLVASAAREAVAMGAAQTVSAEGAWVSVPAPPDSPHRGVTRTYARADLLTETFAVGVTAADVVDGRLSGARRFAELRWRGVWVARDAAGFVGGLPDPATWRSLAVAPGPDAPLATCWAQRGGTAGRAWVAEIALRVVAAVVLAALAVAPSRRAAGAAGAVALVIAWRVLQTGTIAAVASGSWPLIAVIAPMTVAAIGVRTLPLTLYRSFPTMRSQIAG